MTVSFPKDKIYWLLQQVLLQADCLSIN